MSLAIDRRCGAGVQAARRRLRQRLPSTLAALGELIRFPTVSSDASRGAALRGCAERLAGWLRGAGLDDVAVVPGRVAPAVVAGCRGPAGAPTLLVYGHYDVQPPGPRAAWATDPFEPVVVGSYLHARGASDDKGQLMAHLASIDGWLRGAGGTPVGLRVVLDGEEEIGSPTLLGLVEHRDPRVAADVAVVSDTRMRSPCQPVLVTALRGSVHLRLEVHTARSDVHVGAFGGAVCEPARLLVRLVASLHDAGGQVAVPGFADDVGPVVPDRVRNAAPGWPSGTADPATRPVVVVTDLGTSAAGRTVVPAKAWARLNVRLVPGQDPATAVDALRRHLARQLPPDLHATVRVEAACPPFRLRPAAPGVAAAVEACRIAFGRPPLLQPSGGSIPVVSALAERGGPDTLLLGFGLPDDGAHGPNERLYLPNLVRGAAACVELYGLIGGIRRRLPAAQRRPVAPDVSGW